jgi:exopolysaccharide biosynthesis polyprenyl glycosylphosphotransferase
MLLTTAPVALATMGAMGAYRSLFEQSPGRVFLACVAAPLAGLSVITSVMFALRNDDWSRLFVFSYVGLLVLSLLACRLAIRFYVHWRLRRGAYTSNTVLVGSPMAVRLVEQIIQTLPARIADHFQVVGYLLAGVERETQEEDRPMTQCLGRVTQLDSLLIRRSIQEVVLIDAGDAPSGDWLAAALRDCDIVGVPVRIVPVCVLTTPVETLCVIQPRSPLPLPAIAFAPPTYPSEALFIKRVFDIVSSGLLLFLLAPVLAVIAAAVKLSSPGPVLYRWRVVGKHGHEFTGYKFRTMVEDADEIKQTLLDQNEMTGPVFKLSKDPRITRLGRFLRKYSLDELPQLYSVLIGDMSLVGPRPAFRSELERYEFWQMRKLSTKPGITCLWQVRGRNSIVDFDEWVRMDLEYIDRWSLWLDLKILARTAWAVVAGTGK